MNHIIHKHLRPFLLRLTDLSNIWAIYLVLVLIILAGLLIRTWRLTFVSIWYDEYLTVQTISIPIKNILVGIYPREINPPFYFFFLKVWNHILGYGEIQMRLLSLIMSVLSLPLMFFVTQWIGGDWRVSLGSTALLAFHPLYIHYSTEIRMYTLMIFATLLTVFFYLLYLRKPKLLWLAGFFLSMLITLFTHYFGFLILIGLVIYTLYRAVNKQEKALKKLLFVLVTCCILYLPCLYFIFLPQVKSLANYLVNPVLLNKVNASIILGLISGSGEISLLSSNLLEMIALPVAVIGIITLLILKRISTAIFLVGFLSFCGIIAILLNIWGLNIVSRYLLHVNLFGLILVSFTLTSIDDIDIGIHRANNIFQKSHFIKIANIAGIIVLIVMIYSGLTQAINKQYPYPNWKVIAAFVTQVKKSNEPIVIMGWEGEPIKFYLPNAKYFSINELNQALTEVDQQQSFILIDTQYGSKLPILGSADLLYQSPDNQVRVLRYTVNSRVTNSPYYFKQLLLN